MGRIVEHWFHPNNEELIPKRRDFLTLIFLSKKSMRLTSSVANRTSYQLESQLPPNEISFCRAGIKHLLELILNFLFCDSYISSNLSYYQINLMDEVLKKSDFRGRTIRIPDYTTKSHWNIIVIFFSKESQANKFANFKAVSLFSGCLSLKTATNSSMDGDLLVSKYRLNKLSSLVGLSPLPLPAWTHVYRCTDTELFFSKTDL